MSRETAQEQVLIEKIRSLPPGKAAEVEAFVDSLAQRDDARLTRAASRLSQEAFEKIWDNPEDAIYDDL